MSQRKRNCDPQVMAVLNDNHVTIANRRMSLNDAIALEKDDRPSTAIAIKLHNVLSRSNLSVSQKQDLFNLTGWEFMCLSCKQTHPPDMFEGKTFYLWGPVEPPRVLLRSGPCKTCHADRECGIILRPVATFKVVMPPECQ